MPLKDILVQVNDARGSDGRFALAVDLAQRHDAHLAGLCFVIEPRLPADVLGMVPPDILEQQRQLMIDQAERARVRFLESCRKAGLSPEIRMVNVLDLDMTDTLIQHARHADLVILGQPDPDTTPLIDRALPADVIMGCGRPAIVVPYIQTRSQAPERVLIAWDGGREAARAVNDALPLLERAKSVTVLLVNANLSDNGGRREPGADIALHLARHGVKVMATRTIARDISVADAILAELPDNGIDLVVMGAYGHSRAREFILGGVTRQMLTTMPVPVLMSH